MKSNTREVGYAHRSAITGTVTRGATVVAKFGNKVGGIVGGYVAGFVLGMPKSKAEIAQVHAAKKFLAGGKLDAPKRARTAS